MLLDGIDGTNAPVQLLKAGTGASLTKNLALFPFHGTIVSIFPSFPRTSSRTFTLRRWVLPEISVSW